MTSSSSSSPLPNLHTITDRPTHDAAIAKAQGSAAVPTLLYVTSSSNPSCTSAMPQVRALAESNPEVQVHIMELTAATAPMIKFGIQNTPIFILMKGKYCETVLGPDLGRVRRLVEVNFG